MLTLYSPWKAHNASGITRFSGLWVKIKAKRNPFLEAQRRIATCDPALLTPDQLRLLTTSCSG